MALAANFLDVLQPVPADEILAAYSDESWPTLAATIELVNEIRPSDLFCYLGARCGQPNGMQNFLRSDDSDNLIHWEWILRHPDGFVGFQGMNFRTEVHLWGSFVCEDTDKARLVQMIKEDFEPYGAEMGKVRSSLEDWVEFVNPYWRVRRAVERLREEIASLNLDPDNDPAAFVDPWSAVQKEASWGATTAAYSRALGLCFGIRSMLPVLAEAYVNLVLFILMRPEIKTDERLKSNVIRQPIDVRIKSLPLNCNGFARQVDYSSNPCRRYHSLVNERNDLLHGNVSIGKLKFNEVYFWGRVPVFKKYRSLWQRSLGIEARAVGLERVEEEIEVVDGLISYVQSCLKEDVRAFIDTAMVRYELGYEKHDGRVGVLFPAHLSDFRVGPSPGSVREDA